MSKSRLTEKQEAFLDALFDGPTKGDLRKSATMAGYSVNSKLSIIYAPLKEEIIELAHQKLAATAPKAVAKLIELLDDPTMIGGRESLLAIREVFDRGGVVKEERTVHRLEGNAMFILPEKKPVQEPKETVPDGDN